MFKKTDSFTVFLALLGSLCVKAAHKMLMKLNLEAKYLTLWNWFTLQKVVCYKTKIETILSIKRFVEKDASDNNLPSLKIEIACKITLIDIFLSVNIVVITSWLMACCISMS